MIKLSELNQLQREFATAVIAFHESVANMAGMTAAERKCAGILADMGSATPGQLMKATGLSSGAITGVVDRLERAGYARREPNPEDRRSVIVHAEGVDRLRALSADAFAALTREMSRLEARYSEAERDLILGHLREATSILRSETAKLRR